MTGRKNSGPSTHLAAAPAGELQAKREKPGQPGGTGSLYQAVLPGCDLVVFEQARQACLQDEIALLRMVMHQVVAQTSSQEPTLEAWLGALNTLSLAAARLGRLLEIERKLAASEDDSLALLALAIHDVMEELTGER